MVAPEILNRNPGTVFLFQSDETDGCYHVTSDQRKGYRDIPAYFKLPEGTATCYVRNKQRSAVKQFTIEVPMADEMLSVDVSEYVE